MTRMKLRSTWYFLTYLGKPIKNPTYPWNTSNTNLDSRPQVLGISLSQSMNWIYQKDESEKFIDDLSPFFQI